MMMSNTEPGTGTQYHVVATTNAYEFAKNVLEMDEREINTDVEREIGQWTGCGRTWTCGRQYFDLETRALFILDAVVRKSSWCNPHPPEEGQLLLSFSSDRFGSMEYDPNRPDEDPTERLIPRYIDKSKRPL